MVSLRSQVILLTIITSFLGSGWIVHAQNRDFKWVVESITDFLMNLVPLLASLALLLFFWGLAEYVFQAGNEGAVEAGRNRMMTGIIGLFAIAAIWGVVTLVGGTFSIL